MTSGPLPEPDYRPPDIGRFPADGPAGTAPAANGRTPAARLLPCLYLALTGLAWLAVTILEVLQAAGYESWSLPVVEAVFAALCLTAALGGRRRWQLAPAFFAWLALFTGGWSGLRVFASGTRYLPLLIFSAGLLVVAVVLDVQRRRAARSPAEASQPGFGGPNDDPYLSKPHTEQELLQVGRDRPPIA